MGLRDHTLLSLKLDNIPYCEPQSAYGPPDETNDDSAVPTLISSFDTTSYKLKDSTVFQNTTHKVYQAMTRWFDPTPIFAMHRELKSTPQHYWLIWTDGFFVRIHVPICRVVGGVTEFAISKIEDSQNNMPSLNIKFQNL